MYNEELKKRFIRLYTDSINTAQVCESIFNSFEKYESSWNDDLCTQDADVLQPVVDNLSGIRVRSKSAKLTILREYVKWCIKMNVPNACNGMLKVEITGIEKLKQRTVASPLHLQMYLDCLFEPEVEKTTDNILRCYYWLAYAGVPEEDILKIKCKDVDFENMLVYYGEYRVAPIYREAIPAFKNCVNLTEFVYKNPAYNDDIYRKRVEGDTLIRGIRHIPTIKSIRTLLSRYSKAKILSGETNLQLSYYRAWLSGVFYRVYEKERAGVPPNFTELALMQMNRTESKSEKSKSVQGVRRRQLERDYLEDYERWKLAFSI